MTCDMLTPRGGYMKTVPYTTSTGIRIGCRYGEYGNRAPIDDPDMLFLQESLLATPEYARQVRQARLVQMISMIVFLSITFGAFLFS
jgi:hypothetical protein